MVNNLSQKFQERTYVNDPHGDEVFIQNASYQDGTWWYYVSDNQHRIKYHEDQLSSIERIEPLFDKSQIVYDVIDEEPHVVIRRRWRNGTWVYDVKNLVRTDVESLFDEVELFDPIEKIGELEEKLARLAAKQLDTFISR